MSKKNRERKQYGSGENVAAAKNETAKFYWILGSVAVLGVGIVGYSVGSKALGNTVSEPIAMAGLEDPTKLMGVVHPVVKGEASAPVTIIEFADFQCPGCQQFFAQVKPMVEAEFVNTGVAKFVFHDFPLTDIHPNAFLAARAGRCAEEQGKFWEFHDVLFRNQSRWAGRPSPVGVFEDYAGDLGLDAGDFSGCLRSDKYADVVTANMQVAAQMQAPGTPTIIVGKGAAVPHRVPSTIDGIREAVTGLQAGG